MAKQLNVGVIGLGYIGKIHTIAYRSIPLCFSDPPVVARLAAVLRSRLDTEQEATRSFALATTDGNDFYSQRLDIVDVCSPNCLHLEHVTPALKAGMAVYCEKPLASTLQDARAMAEAADRSGALTQVGFMLRYAPAIRQMKALIAAGEIGDVFHFRAHMFRGSYLDPNRPMSWRLRCSESGGGAFMDLGAHLVDLTHYLLGKVKTVRALTRTCVSERCSMEGRDVMEAVDVDDWALCTLELTGGAIGALEVTRLAAGARDATSFEVYGSKGALVYQASHPDSVQRFDSRRQQWIDGTADLPSPLGERPMTEIWPSDKFSQGAFINMHMAAAYDFLLNVAEGKPSLVDFHAGVAAQEVIEAAYRSAARGGDPLQLPL